MKVRRFQPGDVEAIARLNERLAAGRATDVVYPEATEEQVRKDGIRERLFVAEDNGEIRGGVWLKEQTFRVRGTDVLCGWLKYPVAESLVNSTFSGVPASLIIQCVREQPRLMALGLGGHTTPLARMLKALRWNGRTVPMLVRVIRPARCLRHLVPLRRSAGRRAAADFLAFSGLGWLGLQALSLAIRIRSPAAPRDYSGEPRDSLGGLADQTWARLRDEYDFIATRDAANVEAMLPASSDVRRLEVRHGSQAVGWVALLRHDFSIGSPDRNFGRLTVGLIADCLAAPEHAAGVLKVALDALVSSGVDIVFSNQLHPAWIIALRQLEFIDAPSNFALYVSPGAGQLGVDWSRAHITRGDCDGPKWYGGRRDQVDANPTTETTVTA